jgi:hypothetical protein
VFLILPPLAWVGNGPVWVGNDQAERDGSIMSAGGVQRAVPDAELVGWLAKHVGRW